MMSTAAMHNTQQYQTKAGKHTQRGFTLIEVLVSLAIFAVLSLAGWQVFDGLSKVKERNQIHTAKLSNIQSAYSQLLRDFSQLIPRAVRQSGDIKPAFSIQLNEVELTRVGVFDPLQQKSSIERVRYQYDSGTKQLRRYAYHTLDQNNPQTVPATIILSDVSEFNVRALDPAETDSWPPSDAAPQNSATTDAAVRDERIPSGVLVDLVVQEQPVQWRFSLIKKMPQPSKAPTS